MKLFSNPYNQKDPWSVCRWSRLSMVKEKQAGAEQCQLQDKLCLLARAISHDELIYLKLSSMKYRAFLLIFDTLL